MSKIEVACGERDRHDDRTSEKRIVDIQVKGYPGPQWPDDPAE